VLLLVVPRPLHLKLNLLPGLPQRRHLVPPPPLVPLLLGAPQLPLVLQRKLRPELPLLRRRPDVLHLGQHLPPECKCNMYNI
jgi:hypothetical protein